MTNERDGLKPGPLTSASEVFALMDGTDPIDRILKGAGVADSTRISVAYALIADRKDRAADQGSSADADTQPASSFQSRVLPWLMECFGAEIAADRVERCDRFIEEALELAQSLDWPKERAFALVDYVYGRPAGEPFQEVGGTMVTLAALCQAAGLDMDANGETELARIMQPEIVQKIRAKQAAKPTGSALPVAASVPGEGHGTGVLDAAQRKAVERAALDAGCHVWRRARLAMVEDGKIIGYPAFSRADMAELARLYREDPIPDPQTALPGSVEGVEKDASDAPCWYSADEANAWASGFNAATATRNSGDEQ